MATAFAEHDHSPETMRSHALAGLRRRDGTIDWSPWYLTEEEDMGQSGEQGQIIYVLQSSLRVLAKERDWSSVLVAADTFFAWVDGQPYVQVSPDIYVLDSDIPVEGPLPRRWETWRPDQRPPRLAVEIVSSAWKKDYEINPARYDHLGVSELVLADQEACIRDLSARGRAPLLVYRRSAQDRLELVYRGPGPGFCAEIGAYLCFQDNAPGWPRLRISRDPGGVDIVPTSEEQVAAAEDKAAAAEDKAAAAEDKAAAAEDKAAAAEDKAAAAEDKAAAAEDKVAAQAEEIASLRARLRTGGRS